MSCFVQCELSGSKDVLTFRKYNIDFSQNTCFKKLLLQRVLVALGRTDEALVVAERGRTRAFVDLLLERQQLDGGESWYASVDSTPVTKETDFGNSGKTTSCCSVLLCGSRIPVQLVDHSSTGYTIVYYQCRRIFLNVKNVKFFLNTGRLYVPRVSWR